MKLMLRRSADQVIYYDEGVGTARHEALRGGAFGWGLSRKVLAGYLWLMENYEDQYENPHGVADEVSLFGFSRGAFTARSLAGFLELCGLLRKDATRRIVDAFELSRVKGLERDHEMARRFRALHSRDIRIDLLAVWDTVGALGDPRLAGRIFESAAHHKVRQLPSIVDHAVHALAIDENRKLFEPTLWPNAAAHQHMEQRWFVGAHANVGGGYDRDGLFLRPLQWIQSHASRRLEFSVSLNDLNPEFDTSFPRDPLNEVGYGAYHFTQWFHHFDRRISLGESSRETLDHTVLEKWAWNAAYRPRPLLKILGVQPSNPSPSRRLSDHEILALLPPKQPKRWIASQDRGFSIK